MFNNILNCHSNIFSKVHITCSSSDGCVSLFSLTESEGLNCLSSWKSHDFEAWITAFDYWNTNIIYTGKSASGNIR